MEATGRVRQVRAACNGQRVASSGQQAAGGARAAGRAGSNPAHASDNVQQSARENSWQLSQVALRARALEYGGRRHATRRMRREAARLRREIVATAPARRWNRRTSTCVTDLGEDDLGENVQAARGIEGEDAGDVHSQEGDDEDNVVALKSEQG